MSHHTLRQDRTGCISIRYVSTRQGVAGAYQGSRLHAVGVGVRARFVVSVGLLAPYTPSVPARLLAPYPTPVPARLLAPYPTPVPDRPHSTRVRAWDGSAAGHNRF
eukprot:3862945-Rhodomonas_salina.6